MEQARKEKVRKPGGGRDHVIRIPRIPVRQGVSARVPVRVPVEAPVKVVEKAAEKAAGNNRIDQTTHNKGGNIMPGFDKTGPMGGGPMTGGARGRCYPDSSGYDPRFYRGGNRGLGLRRGFRGGVGLRRGRGRRAGRGYGWFPPAIDPGFPADATGEVGMLKAQADYLKNSLNAITERIDALENNSAQAT